MQELHIDLNKNRKSIPKLILGSLNISISIILIKELYSSNSIHLLNAVCGIFLFIMGAGYIFEGSGRSLGERFIVLTDKCLTIKLFLFKPEQVFYLDEMKTINIKPIKIEITDTKNELHEIDLSQLDYPLVVELKKRLSDFSGRIKPGKDVEKV